MEDMLQEFTGRTELVGSVLMASLRDRMPGATIDAVLDAARLINIHRTAELLKLHEFETAIHLIEHLCTLNLTDEDIDTLSLILENNSGVWISEKCSHELAILLKNGLFRSTLNFIHKLMPPVQQSTVCFTWASCLGKRLRLPTWCSSRPSPDTGK